MHIDFYIFVYYMYGNFLEDLQKIAYLCTVDSIMSDSLWPHGL